MALHTTLPLHSTPQPLHCIGDDLVLYRICDYHSLSPSLSLTHFLSRSMQAAWGGHLVLCRWLHFRLGVMDCTVDQAGNYAADCAAMGR